MAARAGRHSAVRVVSLRAPQRDTTPRPVRHPGLEAIAPGLYSRRPPGSKTPQCATAKRASEGIVARRASAGSSGPRCRVGSVGAARTQYALKPRFTVRGGWEEQHFPDALPALQEAVRRGPLRKWQPPGDGQDQGPGACAGEEFVGPALPLRGTRQDVPQIAARDALGSVQEKQGIDRRRTPSRLPIKNDVAPRPDDLQAVQERCPDRVINHI